MAVPSGLSSTANYRLTKDDWKSSTDQAWDFPLLRIPGVEVNEIKSQGRPLLRDRDYKVDKEAALIEWLQDGKIQPDELSVKFTIPHDLLSRKNHLKQLGAGVLISALLGFFAPSFTELVKAALGNKDYGSNPKTSELIGSPAKSGSASPNLGPSSELTQVKAVELVNGWLKAKREIFAEPFDRNLLRKFVHTEGPLYEEITSPGKGIDSLKNSGQYYRYKGNGVVKELSFIPSKEEPSLKVEIDEESILYEYPNRNIGPQGNSKYNKTFMIRKEDQSWKIYDDRK
jgi:hypothetical protein